MNGGDKRRSERVIPVVSEEEVVLIDSGDGHRTLAKMLDISDGGTLVYLLVDSDIDGDVGDSCTLMLTTRERSSKLQPRFYESRVS
jgi:hypothetical protein